ncbi:pre-peptidase C-terminal domain-containing protein [Sorangium sp. So ce1335]|uniref:pre-peptidase C-terminal domain-containing protein n=1 Tax=Sorangium sp. So ce1335 TaxID=3133335 RepID=UPI003F643D3E
MSRKSSISGNNNVVFDVRPVNVFGECLARAFFPDTPRDQRNVLIDNTAFGPGEPSLEGVLRHELGHTLGQGAQALYGPPGGGGSGGGGTATSATFSGSLRAGDEAAHGPLAVVLGTRFELRMTGTGDPDLYLRFGAAPTRSLYNCRPYSDGAAETCTLTVPAGLTQAFIMVDGFTASTYQLRASYTTPWSNKRVEPA